MTPKEKAIELFDKIYEYAIFDEAAKQCALIAVDEVINSIFGNYEFDFLRNFWQEVKKEIEAL